MTNSIQKDVNIKVVLAWLFNLGIPLLIYLYPVNDVFTVQIKMYLVVTLFFIFALIFNNLNITLIGILMPVCYVVLGVTKASVAFQSFSNHVIWLVLASFMLSDMMVKVGIAKRLVYKCMILTGGSYRGILFGVTLAAIVLTLVIPGKVHFLLAPLCYSLIQTLNMGKSSEAAGIMLTSAFACSSAGLFMYGSNIVMMEELCSSIFPYSLPWLDYIIKNIPTIVFTILIVFLFSILFKPQNKIQGKEFFVEEYKKLGKFNREEIITVGICLLLVFSLLTSSWHGIQIGWCFVLCASIFFLPGIQIGTEDDLKKINYGFVIFLAACFTIGNVAADLNIGQILCDILMPYLTNKSAAFVLMTMWLIGVILNVFMTPNAIIASMTLPFATVALNLGINPEAVYFIMLSSYDQLFFPYESGVYLIHFGFGVMTMKHFMKGMYLKIALTFVFLIVALIPFWKLIGFLYL